MWRGVSDLTDRGARVELISLLFYVWISCQTLTKYPSVSWIIEIFDCKFGQESNIVKSNFMITQSCKLLQVDTFHSKQPIDFLSAKWMQTRRICVWQMTADNICLILPPWSPQQSSVTCDSVFSGPGLGVAHHGNQKTNHQCKHQPPLSNWQISCWD